jgi:molybdate transport system ATP-binding protein
MRIELDCGFPLISILTKPACAEMELREGAPVLALVKAPQIHLVPRSG